MRGELVALLTKVLRDEGAASHDWRCAYPNQYPVPCRCYEQTAEIVADAITEYVATKQAEALGAAADAIETDPYIGHGYDVICSCLRCEVALGAARAVRDRANQIEGDPNE